MWYLLDTLGWELDPQRLRNLHSSGFSAILPWGDSHGLGPCSCNYPRLELYTDSSTVLNSQGWCHFLSWVKYISSGGCLWQLSPHGSFLPKPSVLGNLSGRCHVGIALPFCTPTWLAMTYMDTTKIHCLFPWKLTRILYRNARNRDLLAALGSEGWLVFGASLEILFLKSYLDSHVSETPLGSCSDALEDINWLSLC